MPPNNETGASGKIEKMTRRFFHENRQPEVYFTIDNEVFLGTLTDFSDDELRLLCSSEIPLETGTEIKSLYLKKIEENCRLNTLRVRRIRTNTLTNQLLVSLFFADREQANRFRTILEEITIPSRPVQNHDFNPKKFPRFLGSAHYSDTAIQQRLDWIEGTTSTPINFLNQSALFPPSLSGNIENYLGAVQIPVGIAGPILVNGIYTNGYVPLPIATTEGALVSSITRGAMVTNLAGGIQVHVIKQQMIRAPVFFCEDIHGAINLESWILEHEAQIAEQAERMSSVAKLIRIVPFLFGETVHLRFHFQTGDAAGQNMTTSCTWFACEWIVEQIEKEPYINFIDYAIEGNLAGDKKVTAQNFLMGRGISVTATCQIPGRVMNRFLRISPKGLVRKFQASEVAALHSGMIGHNINFANAIAGIFVATGQDIACVHESSCGIIKAREVKDDFHLTVYLPSLVIGTVGGGTGLPTQKECLEILGCYGQNQLFRFAEIIAASCLALDLSTAAAVATNEFVSAHEKLGRNRNTRRLAKSEIDTSFFTQLLNQPDQRVVALTEDKLNSNEGLVSNLASKSKQGVIGLFKYRLEIKTGEQATSQELPVVLKLKSPHRELLKAASAVAKLSGEDLLPGHFEAYHTIFGFDHCDVRELAIYEQISPKVLKFCPSIYGVKKDEQREIYAVLMEDLSHCTHITAQTENKNWTPAQIRVVLRDLAKLHCVYWENYEAIPEQAQIPLFSKRYNPDAVVLLKEITRYNAKCYPQLISKSLLQDYLDFLDQFEDHLAQMDAFPKTLIHYDLNPRNTCLRPKGQEWQLVTYDWELAAFHNPQRDLIEFLSATLSPSTDKADFLNYVRFYQKELSQTTGQAFSETEFWKILRLNAYEFALIRLNLYLLVRNLMNLNFINPIYQNLIRFGIKA